MTTRQWLERLRRKNDPWIDMADRVNRGEMDKQTKSILQSLYVGMRKSRQPECVEAVKRLKSHKEFSRVPEFVFRDDKKR
jgi:hypothetical protein